jgi:predicted AAA+ superfamily ATPase
MYTRLLKKPAGSVLLLGPRGTGKSTWIRRNFSDAVRYDLLDTREALRFERNPSLLFNELKALPEGSLVVLDEIQKVPALMNEVHRCMESLRLKFVLCGSSARKLKRGGVNLLAGRAVLNRMHALTSAEMGTDFNVERALVYGTLPLAVTGADPEGFLTTYVSVYLNEEIRAEAFTRNVGAFSRFLEVAARQNGQVTNISNIARDASVGRTTVQNYFDILADTLIGYWVPAWKLKRSTKQVSHPKFYLFDTGVARAMTGRLPYPPTQEELGPLFENLILNEIAAYLDYNNLRYPPFFWRNYDGTEVDFLCEIANGFVALEIKVSREWKRQFNRGLERVREEFAPAPVKTFGIFRGSRKAEFNGITVYPVEEFLRLLWQGEIIS